VSDIFVLVSYQTCDNETSEWEPNIYLPFIDFSGMTFIVNAVQCEMIFASYALPRSKFEQYSLPDR